MCMSMMIITRLISIVSKSISIVVVVVVIVVVKKVWPKKVKENLIPRNIILRFNLRFNIEAIGFNNGFNIRVQ